MSFICYVASMKLKESQKLETDGNKLAMLLSFFFCQFQTNICLQNHRNEKWTKACNIQQKVLDILKNWQCQSLGFLCHHPGAVDAPCHLTISSKQPKQKNLSIGIIPKSFKSNLFFVEWRSRTRRNAQMYLKTFRWLTGNWFSTYKNNS